MTSGVKVFVYGSLLEGLSNHQVLKRAKGRALSDAAWTVKEYLLADLGAFPGVVKLDNMPEDKINLFSACIAGELYEVETLSHLDALEGYPNFYGREFVEIEYLDLECSYNRVMAWLYYLPEDLVRDCSFVPPSKEEYPELCWKKHFEEKAVAS